MTHVIYEIMDIACPKETLYSTLAQTTASLHSISEFKALLPQKNIPPTILQLRGKTMSMEKTAAAMDVCKPNQIKEGRLEGKVAIVTGGASGIGEAAARLFAKHGAKVIIADIAEERGRTMAETLSPWATYIHCDVTKEEHVSAAVDMALQKHGRLDIMFNNAGIVDRKAEKSVSDYDMNEFQRVINVNVNGVMHGIKHAGRAMIPQKRGCIISTASIAGILGGIAPYAYTASKHAIIGLTKNGAAELGKYGIRVNAVSPTGLATAMTLSYNSEEEKANVEAFCNSIANLKGPTLRAEDVAEVVLYLASDEAKYVSGHNLVVDGGSSVVNHDWGHL